MAAAGFGADGKAGAAAFAGAGAVSIAPRKNPSMMSPKQKICTTAQTKNGCFRNAASFEDRGLDRLAGRAIPSGTDVDCCRSGAVIKPAGRLRGASSACFSSGAPRWKRCPL
jgi:hypothetical protein